MSSFNRREVLVGAATSVAAVGLAGCKSPEGAGFASATVAPAEFASMYAAVPGERFPVNAIDLDQVNNAYLRREVTYNTREPAGTIVVDPQARYLYHVQGGGRAMRYGVGVGRDGFSWSGTATINSKQKWPDWYPPKEMLERQPELQQYITELRSGLGMAGGPRNPLGARALYLWENGRDTLYRIHGTPEYRTIGRSTSSGCIRMINQDAIHLYDQVPVGTRVVVLGPGAVA